jgi:hypothetical protein|tara:strand:+ start:1555 stop:2718 length:1164 start_codon:yes stop_codon:yes gene_type:complete
MASTFVNNLRLEEIGDGEQAGSWGTTTNENLELIAEAFGYGTEGITTNADTHTTTIADGATDPGRSIFLKYTGTLDSACTITIAPNTVSKLWLIQNSTSGSQNIIIKQGSGATVTIANGETKAIYSDGAGSGGAMIDAFTNLSLAGTLGVAGASTLTGAVTASAGITSTGASNTLGATSFNDANITNVGSIALDTITADDTNISITSDVIMSGTTPTLTIGDAGAEDTKIVFDGNATDFYIALDDSADDLLIGTGSTVGSNIAIAVDNTNYVPKLYHNGSLRIETTADGTDFSGTGSIKVPVGTTAQRNSSPAAGDFRYNSTTGAFEGYTDAWGSIGGGTTNDVFYENAQTLATNTTISASAMTTGPITVNSGVTITMGANGRLVIL